MSKKTVDKIVADRYVELISFSLMPNHFHILAGELTNNGISHYMQRIQNSYTKYFNTKYNKSGHLLEGPFKAVHIETNEQLLYLSAYIHRNPHELKEWQNKADKFPWSSHQDYTGKNRWGALIKPEVILGQFSGSTEYKNFVETSGIKDFKKCLDKKCLLDYKK